MGSKQYSLDKSDGWMALAERLGCAQMGRTGLNPAVGCVIVKNGVVVGRGATANGGRPHAEAIALEQAGQRAEDADVYVTLEPCAHFGQTPPCAERLIAAKVARVYCPWQDPDPRTAGKGFAALRVAGIEVHQMRRPANDGIRGFMINQVHGRPFVALKVATSLDGKIALSNGKSQWISGDVARLRTRALRASFAGIAVGIGTALADDPQLSTRLAGLPDPRPIVFDRQGRLPSNAKLFQNPNLVIVTGEDAPSREPTGAQILHVPEGERSLDLNASLAAIYQEANIGSILLEGGAQLAASFLRENLVDRIYHVATGAVMGGDAMAAVGALGLQEMRDVLRFEMVASERWGSDCLLVFERAMDFQDF